jgi:rhomboid family protein
VIPLRDVIPSRTTPVVTITLIVINTLIFLYEQTLGEYAFRRFVMTYGLVPVSFEWTAVITSMFLHGGWEHFLGNMLYLWIFSDNVEDRMGHARFVVFYVICGVAAAIVQTAFNPDSAIPMIGASGAISGVLGAYMLLFPHARVLVGVPLGFVLHTMRLPAIWVLLLWFGLQLLSNVFSQGAAGGVAFRAHIGGFLAGMVLIPLFKHRDVQLWHPRRY